MQVYVNKDVQYDFGRFKETTNTFEISSGDTSRNPGHLAVMDELIEDFKNYYPSTEWKKGSDIKLLSLLHYYSMEEVVEVWKGLPDFYKSGFAQILLGALVANSCELATTLISSTNRVIENDHGLVNKVNAPGIVVLQAHMRVYEQEQDQNIECLRTAFYYEEKTYGYIALKRKMIMVEMDLLASPRIVIFDNDTSFADVQTIGESVGLQTAEPDDVEGRCYNVITSCKKVILAIGNSQLETIVNNNHSLGTGVIGIMI